jgi:hypothetical protein
MLPRNIEFPGRWKRILEKMDRYSDTRFKNEVLGISDSLGARLVSKEELEVLCEDYDIFRKPSFNENFSHVVAGIDWSGGGTEGVSRTVLWIWGVTSDHRLKTLYFRIYPVTNPQDALLPHLPGHQPRLGHGRHHRGTRQLQRQPGGRRPW